MEELEPLTLEAKYTKPFPEKDRPYYSECDKRIIAWSIAWEGTITITKQGKKAYKTSISISNTDFELLDNFKNLIKIGKTTTQKAQTKTSNPHKIHQIANYRQVLFVLNQLKGYMPCRKYRKLRSLIAEFCASRIKANDKARLYGTPVRTYSKRERQIYREIAKLNKRGR
jgi:hypothetical protein